MPVKFRSAGILLFACLMAVVCLAVPVARELLKEHRPSNSAGIANESVESPDSPVVEDSRSTGISDVQNRKRDRKASLIPKRSVLDALEDEVAVEFAETTLREALQFLQERQGISLWIDEAALAEQKGALERTVNLSAEDKRFDWVLDRLLLSSNLDWLVERNLIRITTAAEANKHLEARAYDVLDLTAAGFDEEILTTLIEGCVDPETWSPSPDPETGLPKHPLPKGDSGKSTSPSPAPTGRGTTRIANGVLVVWQTQRVQAKVVTFLDDLETILDEADEDRRFDPHVVNVSAIRRSGHRHRRLRSR